MAENDQNLGANINSSDLSSIATDDALEDINIDEVAMSSGMNGGLMDSQGRSINGDVFLDSGDEGNEKTEILNKETDIGKYVRRIFVSGIVIIIGVIFLALAYSFDLYIKQASKPTADDDYKEYVTRYRTNLGKVKDLLGYNYIGNYQTPREGGDEAKNTVNGIINATDIDYIDKKELLSAYVSSLSKNMANDIDYMVTLKERIAKQGFLPSELDFLLSNDQAIDTIQRSLNALEIIKFSTATKVFSYMNTALTTLSEMLRANGASIDSIKKLFSQLNSNGEKNIESYVYMCYLNPFETNANCNRIGDLDLYYRRSNDKSIDIELFKNTMNAISQLLEKGDTTLFSITFNGFDVQDNNISFNIEVYVNQEDEKALLAQGQRNPNIFILTNIINLLKQSRFIIGADINTKDMNVVTRSIDSWGVPRTVKYSNMDFSVPIQKNMEREIFDYINLEGIEKLLTDRGLQDIDENNKSTEKIAEMTVEENEAEYVEENEVEYVEENEAEYVEENEIEYVEENEGEYVEENEVEYVEENEAEYVEENETEEVAAIEMEE